MEQIWHYLEKTESFFDTHLFQKIPNLPKDIRKTLTSALPYLALLFLIGGLPLFFIFVGISVFLLPFKMGSEVASGFMNISTLVLSIVSIFVFVFCIAGLFKKNRHSWQLLFLALLIQLLISILSFNLIGIIFFLVVNYFLFQIKEYYH